MSKTKTLQTAVENRLAEICPRVFYRQVPKKEAQTPYAVYDLLTVLNEDAQQTLTLNIYLIDYGTDSTNAEEIADKIEKAFEKWSVMTDELFIYTYFTARQPDDENDDRIIMRRIEIEVHTTERSFN